MTSLTLLTVFALAAVALSAPMSGKTFSIKATSHKLAPEATAALQKSFVEKNPAFRTLLEAKRPVIKFEDDSNNQVTLNLQDWYQYALITNVSIGTPAQSFNFMVDIWSSDLEVVDVNAVFDTEYCDSSSGCGDQNDALAAKNTYNASASSTSTVTKKKFRGFEPGDTGVIAKDTVTLGSVSVAGFSFGDITQVGAYLDFIPIDGVLGISAVSSQNKISNVQKQLVSSLASPVITLHVNRSIVDQSEWPATDAEILFGSNALPQCNASNWQTIALSKPQYGLSNALISSISIGGAGVNGPCDNSISQASRPIVIGDFWGFTSLSVQTMDIFKKASGATWNNKIGWYTVDCSALDTIPPINIGLSDGNTLALSARDYTWDLSATKLKTCILAVSGDFDEGIVPYQAMPIVLNQSWLNRHCISYDINANTLSYTDALPNNGQ